MPRKAQPKDSFEARVITASKLADTTALATTLGQLVVAKARRAVRRTTAIPMPTTPMPSAPSKRRGKVRRLGKYQRYTATTKPDISRYGTFRKYVLTTIRAHTDTHSANQAHALCDNPAFAKNRLDFNWAADNGYITFD